MVSIIGIFNKCELKQTGHEYSWHAADLSRLTLNARVQVTVLNLIKTISSTNKRTMRKGTVSEAYDTRPRPVAIVDGPVQQNQSFLTGVAWMLVATVVTGALNAVQQMFVQRNIVMKGEYGLYVTLRESLQLHSSQRSKAHRPRSRGSRTC
jgi:hypothetical protein